jgi:choline-glycine betaine transporter
MKRRKSRIRRTLALIAAVLLGAFSIAGWLMVASLAGAAGPDDLADFRTAAWIYIGLFTLSVVVAASVIVSRWRERRGSRLNGQ